MGIKDTIQRLLKEAELYKKQGLLNEAGQKYSEAQNIIAGDARIKNKEKLLEGIGKKIDQLEANTKKVLGGPSSPELSEKAQDLIKKLFSFSKEESEEETILEGAMALAKFGQFESALQAISWLQEHQVELMFVDINMPDLNGLEFVKSLNNPARTKIYAGTPLLHSQPGKSNLH